LVHHGQVIFLEKNHQKKALSFKGNILFFKFLILKNNSSINGHKLVVSGKCSHTHTHTY
jgi:hypothetical protein